MNVCMAVLIFVLGASIFSFLNVIVYRIPRKMDFVKGRSVCPSCGQQLKAGDLIPVLSCLVLRGKCRYCGVSFGYRDAVLEFAGGCLALLSAWYYRDQLPGAVTLFAFFCVLETVAGFDRDTMEIPDECHIVILLLAAISYFTMPGVSVLSRLIGVFCVSVPMLLLTLAIPGAFGGGDIKLMGACGAFLGWKVTLISFLFGCVLGGIYGVYALASRKKERRDHFAFGPCLCAGMVIGCFAGMKILEWYLQFFAI